ncbi:MAG: diguanylate cyclase, partial [Chloroflexi bacterium]|nr:diguanylate cyclase [Chloroflexota bacterium]
ELCVPLKSKERILGVINAESREFNAFTANDENLMDILAGQLATALEYLRSREAERHWMDTLAHSNELISALSHITTQVERAFSPSDVIRTIEEEFQKMGLVSLLSLYLPEKGQMMVQFESLVPDGISGAGSIAFGYQVQAEKMETLFGIENILAPMVLPAPLKAMETILEGLPPNVATEILCSKGVKPDTEIIHLPLLFEDRLLGALWLWGNDLTRDDLPVMSIFARQMAITLENARLFEEVQNLAITDPLTGLYNRRGLFEIGKIEFARSRRANRPFSAIMVDIDHFKEINDTYGHFTGDRVLQKFARLCRNSIRDVDLVGRYGGEEIVILLPETSLTAGMEVAERLRKRISHAPIKITDEFSLQITASLGVAQQDENTLSLETLIEHADQSMYIAKRKGRNRVAKSS